VSALFSRCVFPSYPSHHDTISNGTAPQPIATVNASGYLSRGVQSGNHRTLSDPAVDPWSLSANRPWYGEWPAIAAPRKTAASLFFPASLACRNPFWIDELIIKKGTATTPTNSLSGPFSPLPFSLHQGFFSTF